jgi:hypothetical protein
LRSCSDVGKIKLGEIQELFTKWVTSDLGDDPRMPLGAGLDGDQSRKIQRYSPNIEILIDEDELFRSGRAKAL